MRRHINIVYVIITSHNRRQKTLECLSLLYGQKKINSLFELQVFLVEDNSQDGTSHAVKSIFPQVHILNGSGNLFWNKGMNMAWQAAVQYGVCDWFLWLNDDTFLDASALENMLNAAIENPAAIICGTTKSSRNGEITYGGFCASTNTLIKPNGRVQSCDYFNGNCVLIPLCVFQKLGYLDKYFHHAFGDFDYGLRAISIGIPCLVAGDYVGSCESHSVLPRWFNPSVAMWTRLKILHQSSCGCNPKQHFKFELRHKGLPHALFHYCSIHLRAIAPSLWKDRNRFL